MSVCHLYVVEVTGRTCASKIGISANPHARLSQLQTGSPFPLRIARMWKFDTRDEAREMESILHHIFADSCTSGEWFEVMPAYISAAILGLYRENPTRDTSAFKVSVDSLCVFARENAHRLKQVVEI